MHTLLAILAIIAGIVGMLTIAHVLFRGHRDLVAYNLDPGVHADGNITKKSDAAITTRYLLGKDGSDDSHIAACGAADLPLGVITDEAAAAEDYVNIQALGHGATVRMVASEAITVGEDVYTAASGKIQDEPAAAGTYYKVGTALTAASADGDTIEIASCVPVRTVVLAAITNANGDIGGLTISASYSQAEVQALQAACEVLADDVRAITAALSSPAALKVLS